MPWRSTQLPQTIRPSSPYSFGTLLVFQGRATRGIRHLRARKSAIRRFLSAESPDRSPRMSELCPESLAANDGIFGVAEWAAEALT